MFGVGSCSFLQGLITLGDEVSSEEPRGKGTTAWTAAWKGDSSSRGDLEREREPAGELEAGVFCCARE